MRLHPTSKDFIRHKFYANDWLVQLNHEFRSSGLEQLKRDAFRVIKIVHRE